LLLADTYIRLIDRSRPTVAAGSEERGGDIGSVAAGIIKQNLGDIIVRE
jgi:hypothetical protein